MMHGSRGIAEVTRRRRRRPLYIEVQESLQRLLTEWPRMTPLPSEPKLASRLGVSRPTIREILHALEREGVILRRHGVGTFVLGPGREVTTGLEELRGIPRIIRASGKSPSIDHQRYTLDPAPPVVAEALHVPPGENVLVLRQVYLADGGPIALGFSRIPSRVGISLDRLGREAIRAGQQGRPLFEVLDRVAKRHVRYAVAEIDAELPDEPVAALLQADPAIPLVKLIQTHFDEQHQPVIHSTDYIVWHRFKLQIVRHRRTRQST